MACRTCNNDDGKRKTVKIHIFNLNETLDIYKQWVCGKKSVLVHLQRRILGLKYKLTIVLLAHDFPKLQMLDLEADRLLQLSDPGFNLSLSPSFPLSLLSL